MNRAEYTFKHAMPVVITVFRNHDFIGLNDNHAIPIIQFPQILYVILSYFLFCTGVGGGTENLHILRCLRKNCAVKYTSRINADKQKSISMFSNGVLISIMEK
jgi:hypothetical protein